MKQRFVLWIKRRGEWIKYLEWTQNKVLLANLINSKFYYGEFRNLSKPKIKSMLLQYFG